MSGVISAVAWAESEDELYARYKASAEVGARKRLHALWLVRGGSSAREAARQAGVGERTVVRWLGWYRQGGVARVLERVPGHGALGRASRLSEEQKWALVQEHDGVCYGYKGLYSVLRRAGVRPKVPRPRGAGRPGRPRGVERGGCTRALRRAGVSATQAVHFADELRLGLRGPVRRVLAPRGVKVRQALQLRYAWRYLLLAVGPLAGTLRWAWLERLTQDHLRPVLADWALDCVVWDGAGSHRGKRLRDLPTRRVLLPPYAPELNPAERIFEEIRRRVEGLVYESLDAKEAAVERYLTELAADPARVRRLCAWTWIADALARLPAPTAA